MLIKEWEAELKKSTKKSSKRRILEDSVVLEEYY